jgi:hypothetical protein
VKKFTNGRRASELGEKVGFVESEDGEKAQAEDQDVDMDGAESEISMPPIERLDRKLYTGDQLRRKMTHWRFAQTITAHGLHKIDGNMPHMMAAYKDKSPVCTTCHFRKEYCTGELFTHGMVW